MNNSNFAIWLEELKEIIRGDMLRWADGNDESEPYDYVEQTGIEPWLEMFNEGMSPIEAWEEEKAAIAMDCE